MVQVESERLVLYPINDDELKSLVEHETNEALKQAYREMLQGCQDDPEHRIWYTVWFIELKSEPGTIVGDLSFKGLNADGMVEIGYGLRDGFCGKGYMTEAVRALCRWAMEQDGVSRVEAEATAENCASQRVLSHAGFIPTGECGEEGPRFLYRQDGSYFTGYSVDGYQVLERTPTGSGYDLKLKISVDGAIRYLYYSEMPDRCYIRGWSFYEISESNYNANKREPYIRYIGSISGDNYVRADYAIYRALKEGLYIKSKWDYCYGDIYLVKDLKIKTPLVDYETIEGDYYQAVLSDGSTHYLYRELIFIHLIGQKYVLNTRWYKISEETFNSCVKSLHDYPVLNPPYIRYLGGIPSQSVYSSDWSEKEKAAQYRALTEDVSIYPYVNNGKIVLKPGQCNLHEPFEIIESVYDHDSNDKYYYTIWKVLIDGKDVVYLLLIQAKEGDTAVKIYEISKDQLQNEYICHNKCTENGIQLIWEIDDSVDRRDFIFRHSNVYHYMIASDPKYGGIPLNEDLDGPMEFVRLVCTLPDAPDVFSEDFCKKMYEYIRGNQTEP